MTMYGVLVSLQSLMLLKALIEIAWLSVLGRSILAWLWRFFRVPYPLADSLFGGILVAISKPWEVLVRFLCAGRGAPSVHLFGAFCGLSAAWGVVFWFKIQTCLHMGMRACVPAS